MKAIEEEEFRLSPLAQVIGTWPSAIQSFWDLVDEDDDLKKTCRMKESERVSRLPDVISEEEAMDEGWDIINLETRTDISSK